MKKIIFIFISLLILTCASSYAAQVNLTLDEALALALRNNRDVLLKVQDLYKAKLKISEAKAALFPGLTLNSSITDTRGLYSKDLTAMSNQVGLKQYLYQGGKTVNSIKYNEYSEIIAQAFFDKTKLELVYNVKKAFYTLLLAQDFYTLNKGIYSNTYLHFDTIKQRYEKGEASQSDILMMTAALAQVKQALESSSNQLEHAKAYLKNLLYLDESVVVRAIGKFTCRINSVVYKHALASTRLNRPEIKQYNALEKASQAAVDIAKAGNRPSIYASWDYYGRSHSAAGTTKNWNDYNVIGITVSWPIFDGWLTKSKIDQALVDLSQARILKERVLSDIILDLENAYIDLKDSIGRASAFKKQVEFYKDTFLTMQDKYKAGIASNLDLDDTRLSYKVSLFNQKQAVYDCIIANAKFNMAKGEM